jgi:hypothetical protein
MLILADADGYVGVSVPGLAQDAGVTVDECLDALKKFAEPDKFSRTKTSDGRRIREADGGWLIINHRKYREMRSRTQMKATDRKRRSRAKSAAERDDSPRERDERDMRDMSQLTEMSRAEAEAEAEAEKLNSKEDEVSAKAGSRSARETGKRTHRAPRDFKPTELQVERCIERGLDPTDELARFLAHKFKAAYGPSDWLYRFDEWILDADKFKHGPPRSRPSEDRTGFESVGDDAAIDDDADDDEDAAQ